MASCGILLPFGWKDKQALATVQREKKINKKEF